MFGLAPMQAEDFLADFVDSIQQSRDCATQGKLEDAILLYDGVVAQIKHRLKALPPLAVPTIEPQISASDTRLCWGLLTGAGTCRVHLRV